MGMGFSIGALKGSVLVYDVYVGIQYEPSASNKKRGTITHRSTTSLNRYSSGTLPLWLHPRPLVEAKGFGTSVHSTHPKT